jgi:hypothetical protein
MEQPQGKETGYSPDLESIRLFENGQSYVVLGYGITDKIDIQGYYSRPVNNNEYYYAGLFYQFYESNRIDLATAIGLRKYINDDKQHILYTAAALYSKTGRQSIEIGGSFVGLVEKEDYLGTAIDAAIYIPIINKRKYVDQGSKTGGRSILASVMETGMGRLASDV